jgi:plastocyanin
MKSKLRRFSMIAICGLAPLLFLVAAAPNPDAQDVQKVRVIHNQVIVPGEDRFTPFAQTIHAGEAVRFMNMDTDDHTVVSLDAFNTAGNRKLNVVLKGTDNNGGKPGTLVLHFNRPGTFVYYCRFHSHLDDSNQPVAPGPDQGIQDPDGNFGTPMMGIITVVP